MKSAILALALGAIVAQASPVATNADLDTLNFALTLEHVEVAFYTMGLQNYTQQDFVNAGLPVGARTQFERVLENESAHVRFLTNLLGERATKPCRYQFPVSNAREFAMLSQVIENVGTGAYTGATGTLSPQYITGSASILSTEARQASLIAAYINGVEGWGSPFNIALTKNEAFTLAAPFIVSCPSSNPTLADLGVHANPALTLPANANPGDNVPVYFNAYTNQRLWAVFLNGLDQIVVPIRNGRVTIPSDLAGQVYVLISTTPNGVTDGSTVAGPAILQFQSSLTNQYLRN